MTAHDGDQDAPAQDDWRHGGLPALRAELDRIDDAIHDLLMRRAGVVEYVARSGKPAAFRPGREAEILRRLLSRHTGALPPVTLVRLWREMLAGTTAMQGGLAPAVADTDPALPLTQLAREHFGALTPMRVAGGCDAALAAVSQGQASVAVLPYPSETEAWWAALLHHQPRLYIIARLPFWRPRPGGVPQTQAVVVAATQADASGDDLSCIGLECDTDMTRTRLSDELVKAGLQPRTMALLQPAGAPLTCAWIETDGFVKDDDPRLARLAPAVRRLAVLGHYARPVGGC